MKWIIDKTYYFCKYNTLKLNKRILENSYIKELKEKMPTKMLLDIAYFEKIEVNKLYEEMKKYKKMEVE